MVTPFVCLSSSQKVTSVRELYYEVSGSSLHATMATKGVTLNTNARKIRFARRFISILLKMRKTRSPCSSSSIEDVRKRTQRIKIAAYSSMAHAVGPRRAWSRAVLFKLRSRARHQSMMKRRSFGLQKKRVVVVKNNNDIIPSGQLSQADRLRQLVPGGKAMDMCSLLEETADYISCLATQVKVMQTIADHFSK